MKYKLSTYERSVLDATIYWYATGRGPFATKALIRCIELLLRKRKQIKGV